MAATQFFTDLFTALTGMSNEIAQGMTNLTSIVMPAFQACFVVYVIMVVWSYWQNESPPHVLFTDLVKRIFLLGLLMGLGINISTYTSTVFPLVTHFGDDLAQAWSGNNGSSMGTMLDGIVHQVSQITDTNMQLAAEAADTPPADPNAPVGTPPTPPPAPTNPNAGAGGIVDSVVGAVNGAVDAVMASTIGSLKNELIAWFQNMLIWIGAWIFLIIAAAFLLIATVLLVILAALGPVFFAFGIFPATRQFFTNWIGQVLSNSVLFLLVSITATIFINFINTQLGNVASAWTNPSSVGGAVGVALIGSETVSMLICMFVVFGVILLQLPNLASSLFGGLAANGFGTAVASVKNAKSMFGGGKNKGDGKDKEGDGKDKGQGGGAVTPENDKGR